MQCQYKLHLNLLLPSLARKYIQKSSLPMLFSLVTTVKRLHRYYTTYSTFVIKLKKTVLRTASDLADQKIICIYLVKE
jgi:hypothetical protein